MLHINLQHSPNTSGMSFSIYCSARSYWVGKQRKSQYFTVNESPNRVPWKCLRRGLSRAVLERIRKEASLLPSAFTKVQTEENLGSCTDA